MKGKAQRSTRGPAAKPNGTDRILKRYANRKLYDPVAKRYVTVDGIAAMVRAGEDVQVLDQKSGEDLTNTFLAQVVLESIKQRTATIPRPVLVRLIRLGSGPAAVWKGPQEAAGRARQEAERIVSGLLSRGRLSLEEALALRQEITTSVQGAMADAQRGLEHTVRGVLDKMEQERGVTPVLEGLRERLLSFESFLGPRSRAQAPRPASRAHKK